MKEIDKVIEISNTVRALETKRDDLKADINNLLKQEQETYETYSSLLLKEANLINKVKKLEATLAKFSGSDILMKYINGELTHYVEVPDFGYPTIHKFNTHSDVRDIKLVTMYGSSNGTIFYKLNKYHDGSGRETTIHPCSSYEDALLYLQCWVTERATKEVSDTLLSFAEKYNLRLDYSWELRLREQKKSELQEKINIANATIRNATEELNKL